MNILHILRKPFRYTFFHATLIFIGINLLVHFVLRMYPGLRVYLSMNPALVVYHKFYWQVLTYSFVHGDFMHLFSNMIGLLFFGISLEHRLGSREFTLLYLVSAVLCGVFSLAVYVLSGMWNVFLLGASGAVFAVLLLYAVFFPRSTIFIWGILPVPAPMLVLGYAALEAFYMIFGRNSGVAHSTHLIGFAIAWLYAVVRFGIHPLREWFPRR